MYGGSGDWRVPFALGSATPLPADLAHGRPTPYRPRSYRQTSGTAAQTVLPTDRSFTPHVVDRAATSTSP
ncbi:hypothetical protein GCM10010230_17520 [Streptomyces narbonensis]|nr:hypothetical protein GCM10010230_17520 [Streptomyces narbonensis]